MASRNDVTGDEIKSRGNTEQYNNNWDAIFGKKKQDEPAVDDASTETKQEQ